MKKWLKLVLHTACVLQAYSYRSSENEDALLQQGSHFEPKVADQFPLNMTMIDKFDTRENALTQLDQLSLVTRYAGVGYNIIRGNPEGDFNRGGIDPGLKTTRVIFAHTYKSGKKAYYRSSTMDVPDQVRFHMSQSCTSSSSVKAFSGRKSYMKELDTSVSVGGGASAFGASLSFSLSAGMGKVESQTKDKKRIIIQNNKICNYGRVRYLYENAVARERGYTLARSFQNSVMYQLPRNYNQNAYMQFIENWGTHVTITVDIGTREIQRSSASYNQVYKYLKKKNQFSTSVGGGYGGFSASVGFSIKNVNENIDQNSKLGKSYTKFTIGSQAVPLPIHLDLKLITEPLGEIWWGGVQNWKRKNIDKKQRNLMTALKNYPRYVHAKNNKDPIIKLKLYIHWPDGTYALPKPRWGCPPGWSSGYTVQDTENALWNKNSKTSGIESKMAVRVDRNNIQFWYCVKRSPGKAGVQWPRGTYCIAMKNKHCPHGFNAGGIMWDDYDYFNKDRKWGTLPDGTYGHDTTVKYCCRGDRNHNVPMTLPTDKPFILYRYGGHCQRVSRMHYTQLFIKWDDNNFINKDKCWGAHPDTPCKPDHLLHFCYYTKRYYKKG